MTSPQSATARAVRSVLVVDDDPRVRESIFEELLDRGFQVGAAESGAKAFGMLMAGHFDAAVLDLIMPGMSGMAVLEGLRRHGKRTPILLLSGYPELLSEIHPAGLGTLAFLEKPFEMDDLVTAVESLVEVGDGAEETTGEAC